MTNICVQVLKGSLLDNCSNDPNVLTHLHILYAH